MKLFARHLVATAILCLSAGALARTPAKPRTSPSAPTFTLTANSDITADDPGETIVGRQVNVLLESLLGIGSPLVAQNATWSVRGCNAYQSYHIRTVKALSNVDTFSDYETWADYTQIANGQPFSMYCYFAQPGTATISCTVQYKNSQTNEITYDTESVNVNVYGPTVTPVSSMGTAQLVTTAGDQWWYYGLNPAYLGPTGATPPPVTPWPFEVNETVSGAGVYYAAQVIPTQLPPGSKLTGSDEWIILQTVATGINNQNANPVPLSFPMVDCPDNVLQDFPNSGDRGRPRAFGVTSVFSPIPPWALGIDSPMSSGIANNASVYRSDAFRTVVLYHWIAPQDGGPSDVEQYITNDQDLHEWVPITEWSWGWTGWVLTGWHAYFGNPPQYMNQLGAYNTTFPVWAGQIQAHH